MEKYGMQWLKALPFIRCPLSSAVGSQQPQQAKLSSLRGQAKHQAVLLGDAIIPAHHQIPIVVSTVPDPLLVSSLLQPGNIKRQNGKRQLEVNPCWGCIPTPWRGKRKRMTQDESETGFLVLCGSAAAGRMRNRDGREEEEVQRGTQSKARARDVPL
ncbi:uncharacterized protein ACIB01_017240 isoform 1-T1 [Guaruba guarouba]